MISAIDCDLHSHTSYSDGRTGVDENAHAAEAVALQALAITDHLHAEGSDWSDRGKLRQCLADVLRAREWCTTRLVMGVEATTTSAGGAITVTDADLDGIELVLVDVGFDTAGLATGAPLGKPQQLDAVLGLYFSLAANPLINVLAHPFSVGRFGLELALEDLPATALRELGHSLAEHGVAFELNNGLWWWWPQYHPRRLADTYARIVAEVALGGARFTLGSDAHCNTSIGNLGWATYVASLAGIGPSQWADLDALVRNGHKP